MKKILVVDDHRLVVEFMTGLLTKQGYKVLTAQDSLAALDILKTETPDVMFVDLIMPNITGEKLCQIARRIPRLEDLYIVVLSGVAAEQKENLAKLGANACIAKGPFDNMGKQVLAVLDQLDLEGSRGLREETQCVGVENVYPRHATKELLAVRRHFEVILDSMCEGILEINHKARIVYANPSAISLTGIAEEKLLGSNFIALFSETDRQRIHELLGAATSSGSETTESDTPSTLNDRQVLLNILPLEDEEQGSMMIILNDVTEKKRLEAQAKRAHKMEAVGTLAGGIAHGFNNLLMGIQGNVSLMLIDMDSKHLHFERLKSIENQVQSGARLTSHLLGYARKGRYEVKPLDLNQIVRETSDTFGRTRKDITIHRELAEGLVAIEADQGQIELVLLNLYVNAADAMPGGGDLMLKTVNTTHKDIKGEGELDDPKPGNYAMLLVTDTGTGMDKETMGRIFDPFFTTKGMGRGTGLGLASVYGITKGHGGYVDVESMKGQGTTLAVYLPASEKKVPKAVKTTERFTKGDETVLLVDDEEVILEVGQDLLETMGYGVLLAKDGREAIEVYEKNREDIDIVLLGMVMPDIGGGEVYACLKEINPDIKVLLSSGLSLEGEATKILKRGCNGFIQKPFNMQELSDKIRGILDKK